ncbi:hemophore-related protein [Mycobacterium sp.]|uniref:hemophore-related protein n=1 Tax=Mycobacterium sp. TaxID=1785 RepID=UPI003C72795A
MALTAGAGVASADPGLDQLINTNCNYSQAVAALNATDAAAAFDESSTAKAWLRSFLASPVDTRARMVQSVQSLPSLQPYLEDAMQAASTCSNF